ncbi:MAG: SlyX family protein [Cyanobacteria bacterium CRU_2_1]|nr:SlyX family protein [Cyanobacteria bacterium RU_5_0]NJR58151.1 SlyX family protein [Cyanobacteria bacterium CRU_2_1]
MNDQKTSHFLGLSFGFVILILLIFGVLQFLHISVGNFLDWTIGAASFWWLLVIVTVPWNIYFGAKAVLADAAESRQKGISVDESSLRYVRQVVQRSLWVAIGLHLLSALGLYVLATMGISQIGYLGSGAALLLTVLRPTIAFYQYLSDRLRSIGRELKYPREDIVELRQRVIQLEETINQLNYQLNDENPDALVTRQQQMVTALRQDLSNLASAHESLKVTNQSEHERLARDAQNAIAQLSADGQFLDHVREIIRFIKSA